MGNGKLAVDISDSPGKKGSGTKLRGNPNADKTTGKMAPNVCALSILSPKENPP